MGALNNKNSHGHSGPQARWIAEDSGRFKKACPELCRREGRQLLGVSRRGQPIAWLILKGETIVSAQRVLPVPEHGKLATCLREAAPAACAPKLASAASAKAGNAAGGFFNSPSMVYSF